MLRGLLKYTRLLPFALGLSGAIYVSVEPTGLGEDCMVMAWVSDIK